LKSGDHIIAAQDLYGGTRRLFERVMRNFNLDFSYVQGSPESFAAAIKPNTRLIWFETPTNPLLQLIDIAAVVKIARRSEHGAILVGVDNTFASPWLQRPLDLGADIVHHSASKYLGGHCDVIAGALMCNDESLAEKLRFNQYAVGGMLGPFESWLVQRGLKTLAVRMERHCQNAKVVAEFLKTVPMVTSVMYPGLDGKPLPNGMKHGGGMISFYIDADFERVKAFCTATEVFVLAESLGGVESLINHPAAMTHASIPRDVRLANGITDGLVRLSVGLEEQSDLIADLQGAFERVGERVRG
jgi:cystathionine gamma-lyase